MHKCEFGIRCQGEAVFHVNSKYEYGDYIGYAARKACRMHAKEVGWNPASPVEVTIRMSRIQ